MTNLIGTTFDLGGNTYIVDSVQEFEKELTAIRSAAEKSGKDTAMYFASKLLKSGKKSKQGGMFYRFSKSGTFIKVM